MELFDEKTAGRKSRDRVLLMHVKYFSRPDQDIFIPKYIVHIPNVLKPKVDKQ
jgi:hypothetical protein